MTNREWMEGLSDKYLVLFLTSGIPYGYTMEGAKGRKIYVDAIASLEIVRRRSTQTDEYLRMWLSWPAEYPIELCEKYKEESKNENREKR